jgi:hypothetical protein
MTRAAADFRRWGKKAWVTSSGPKVFVWNV